MIFLSKLRSKPTPRWNSSESKPRPKFLNLFEDRFESRGSEKKDFCFPFVVSLEFDERFAHPKGWTIFERIAVRYRLIGE